MKMECRTYSVLMSVYKKEKPDFLKAALDSLLEQTEKPNEILLVCDGPLTDELEEAISHYERQITLLRLEKNVGLGEALRQGVLTCKNELILRADTDDINSPDRAQIELDCLLGGAYDLVSSDVLMFSGDISNRKGYRALPTESNAIKTFAKRRCPFNHPSVAFRKSAVLKAGNYQTLLYREDWFLWIRMLQNGSSCCNIPKPLVYMRTSDDQIGRRSNAVAYKSVVELFKYMRKTRFISTFEYLRNRFVFWGQRVSPVWLNRWIYRKFLHNGKR